MRQLIYVSESLIGADEPTLDRLVTRSAEYNASNGVTGLLWTDGKYFAQILEGAPDDVEEVMVRVIGDPRHRNIFLVARADVEQRLFADWAMFRPRNDDAGQRLQAVMIARLHEMQTDASNAFLDIVTHAVV